MLKFRYGICNETFQNVSIDETLEQAARYGYAGVEIAPFTIETDCRRIAPEVRERVRGKAESLGLEVIGLHWLLARTEGFYLTSPDAAVRRATADYLVALGQLCRDLGGRVMVLGSPAQRNLLPGVSHEQGLTWAAEALRPVADVLADLGVVLAIEPLGPAEGNFLLTAESGLELVGRIDSPACQLHLDVKAMSSEVRSIPEILRSSASALAHFHANDPNRLGPGMGEVDFVPILQTLREINYQGWVSVEVFDYAPGPDALAGGSLRYLRECEAALR